MNKPKSFYTFDRERKKIRVFFCYPLKNEKGYEPDTTSFTINLKKLEHFLSCPNRIDYAFEATKICIIQKYHERSIDKNVLDYLKRVNEYRKAFYQNACRLYDVYNQNEGYELNTDSISQFLDELHPLRDESENLTSDFIELMKE